MNLGTPVRGMLRLLHYAWWQLRVHVVRQQCQSFETSSGRGTGGIGPIFIINLDRQPARWTNVLRELGRITDGGHRVLSDRVIRFPAYDALIGGQQEAKSDSIDPFYTLGDQLFVEPQPHALPDTFELARPIKMSPAEIAVARSHVGVWKAVAQSTADYALVLEDDVWFERGFGRILDQAWSEMKEADRTSPAFDVLYLSYKEVRHGAPKEFISKNTFRPERGLWCLSGYVLSRKGAQALLKLLPCRGPVDLWINHKFRSIDVRAIRRSVINQRLDTTSTNSYSILPALTRIGVIDCDSALFHHRPTFSPVFAFGTPGAGLSSLAMALSMLGYRCCSDIDQIPEYEYRQLMKGSDRRIFNAYVNIGSLSEMVGVLVLRYPRAKYIFLGEMDDNNVCEHHRLLSEFNGADLLRMHGESSRSWSGLCEHLRLPPPAAQYPEVSEIGHRGHRKDPADAESSHLIRHLRRDRSPWVVNPPAGWHGISATVTKLLTPRTRFEDDLTGIHSERWLLRSDTFGGNLGLFRPANVTARRDGGISLSVINEPNGVRRFSAAAISSRKAYLYGRFEATLQATNVSGLVTGFFLHRDSPRQEIDIEITGNRPTRLLTNVFYNPGAEGARFDYGYRGTPTEIPLAFDASLAFHKYAIEWDPCEIRWFVDGSLVYRRAEWNPTPIPHLPMTLHVNTWPSRSRELAGRLAHRALPASAILGGISVDAWDAIG